MRGSPKPLDQASLRALALAYVARYATTSGKLQTYLKRKLRERGWESEETPGVSALSSEFAALGYINDASWAEGRSAALKRRGLGERRIVQALRFAGIDKDLSDQLCRSEVEEATAIAFNFARRRRIGPYALTESDPNIRNKWRAAMARAGHSSGVIEAVLRALPADIAEIENTDRST